MIYWVVYFLTAVIASFVIGRPHCSWFCPNATLQDTLYKNLTYKRPIEKMPQAIEKQSHSSAMYLSGPVDKNAPFVPFTHLLALLLVYFIETVFNLETEVWYALIFMYGLFILSFLFPWRKVCTHFCWLSSYWALAGQNSLWRIRFNRSKCKNCKICHAEEACPFHIDIRNQDNEMPATCCLCFSCMDACPHEGVITFRRAKEEKERIKALGKENYENVLRFHH